MDNLISNILLVRPHITQDFTRSGTTIPPLGLAYIAAILRDNGFSVSIWDGEVENGKSDRKADVIGISCNSFTFLEAMKTAKLFKKKIKTHL